MYVKNTAESKESDLCVEPDLTRSQMRRSTPDITPSMQAMLPSDIHLALYVKLRAHGTLSGQKRHCAQQHAYKAIDRTS